MPALANNMSHTFSAVCNFRLVLPAALGHHQCTLAYIRWRLAMQHDKTMLKAQVWLLCIADMHVLTLCMRPLTWIRNIVYQLQPHAFTMYKVTSTLHVHLQTVVCRVYAVTRYWVRTR